MKKQAKVLCAVCGRTYEQGKWFSLQGYPTSFPNDLLFCNLGCLQAWVSARAQGQHIHCLRRQEDKEALDED